MCAIVSVAAFDPPAVGANVTVTVWLPPAGTVRVAGEAVNAASLDWMEVTERTALPVLEMVSVNAFDFPISTFPNASVEGEMFGGGGAVTPVPLRDTAVGLPAASCEIVSVADFDPAAVGRKVTVTTWPLPGLTVKVVDETVKAGSDDVMPVTRRSASPVLDTVKDCWPEALTCTSPNPRVFAERVRAGTVPLPLTDTVEGLPGASCASVSVAVRSPLTVGVNVTVTVALSLALTVNGSAGEKLNWSESSDIAETFSAAMPVFLIRNVCVPVVPTLTLPNEREGGDRATTGSRITVAWFDSPLLFIPASTALTR